MAQSPSNYFFRSGGSSSSSSGSGGTGKNYLSVYKTSLGSGAFNTGNGDLELGGTSGFGKGTTGTLTNGIPTGSPTFGSGSSGNLSIAIASTSTLAGAYSLDYISSAATTAGDCLHTDAFFIDSEDQAKVLGFKFAYKAQTNPTNGNFSGTSSNSFGVAAYDVTNSVWLSLTGSFNIVQSSGIGYATGTFQTGATTASIRFIVYNANASAGAITMRFDDFTVGPQISPQAPVITDWVAYTPTFTGLGTVTAVNFIYRRVGANLEVEGFATSGATSGVEARISFPAGLTSLSTLPTISTAGDFTRAATGAFSNYVLREPSLSYFTWGDQDSTHGGLTKATGTVAVGSSESFSMRASVPIQGWSSNSVSSADTDTRVVAAYAVPQIPSGSVSSSVTIAKFGTITKDTHAGYSTSTGLYTVPVTGWYTFQCCIEIGGTANAINGFSRVLLQQNAVTVGQGAILTQTASGALNMSPSLSETIYCNAGDTVGFYTSSTLTTPTYTNGLTQSSFSIFRVSGPAVINATESVNGSYTDTAGSAVTSSVTKYTYATKIRDSHNAYASGTLTIPVSGEYRFSACLGSTAVTLSTAQFFQVAIFRNGTAISTNFIAGNAGASAQYSQTTTVSYPCNAGDTIEVRVLSSTVTTANTTAGVNSFCWERVGN